MLHVLERMQQACRLQKEFAAVGVKTIPHGMNIKCYDELLRALSPHGCQRVDLLEDDVLQGGEALQVSLASVCVCSDE